MALVLGSIETLGRKLGAALVLGAVLVLGTALVLGCPDGLKLVLGAGLGTIHPLTTSWHQGPNVGYASLFVQLVPFSIDVVLT